MIFTIKRSNCGVYKYKFSQYKFDIKQQQCYTTNNKLKG